MKLFLDRNKTLLPRIDFIYLLTRIMTLIGVVWYAYGSGFIHEHPLVSAGFGLSFLAHLGIFIAAVKNRFDVKLAYLSAIIYDLIFVPVVIEISGGFDSSMYLLFFLTISVAAYVLTFSFAVLVTVTVTVVYTATVWADLTLANMFDLCIRLGFLWVSYLALSYASEYMRKSERRLMKLFDTLNLRTAELEKSQAQLEVIYENTRTLGAILDPEGIIREVMRIMSETLRYPYCSLIQQDRWGHFFYRARVEDGQTTFRLKAIKSEGNELIARVSAMAEPVRLKDVASRDDYVPMCPETGSALIVPMVAHGKVNGLLVAEAKARDYFIDRDIQQLVSVGRSTALALDNAELHRRTEELTVIDELTGTFNYRYFLQKLEEEKKRSLRYNAPLSIIMIDIDWFKKINDTYGHEAGNEVLKSLARTIKECVRDVDIFCRYGGEEFAVILPQTARTEASAIGERIREQVEVMEIETAEGARLKITVSVGVSSFPENGHSHEELVSVADQALYRAKGSGKNLVCSI